MTSISRREWLHRATGVVATASLPALLPGAEPGRSLGLGFGQIGLGSLSIADYFKTCAAIGYQYVDLVAQAGFPADPKSLSRTDRTEIKSRLVDSGLTCCSLLVSLPEPAPDAATHKANLDALKAAANLAVDLAPDAPPVIATNLRGTPEEWEKVRDGIADRIRDWAGICKDAKTVLSIKPHVKSALHSPEGGTWLLDRAKSPWLKLLYDHSHYAVRGLKLADTVAAVVPRSALVHVKDSRGTVEKFEFLLPGDGDTDYREYAKLVEKAGYRGPVMVEVSSMVYRRPGYDGLAAAKRCFEKLAPAFGVQRKN